MEAVLDVPGVEDERGILSGRTVYGAPEGELQGVSLQPRSCEATRTHSRTEGRMTERKAPQQTPLFDGADPKPLPPVEEEYKPFLKPREEDREDVN